MCFILGELEKEKETFIECELCAWHWAEGFFTRAILFNLTTILWNRINFTLTAENKDSEVIHFVQGHTVNEQYNR